MTSGLELSRVLQTQSVQDSPAESRRPPVNEERLQPHLWTWPRCHRRAARASPRLLSQSVAGGGHRPKPGIPRKRDAVGEEGLRARPLLLSLPPASLAPRSAGADTGRCVRAGKTERRGADGTLHVGHVHAAGVVGSPGTLPAKAELRRPRSPRLLEVAGWGHGLRHPSATLHPNISLHHSEVN